MRVVDARAQSCPFPHRPAAASDTAALRRTQTTKRPGELPPSRAELAIFSDGKGCEHRATSGPLRRSFRSDCLWRDELSAGRCAPDAALPARLGTSRQDDLSRAVPLPPRLEAGHRTRLRSMGMSEDRRLQLERLHPLQRSRRLRRRWWRTSRQHLRKWPQRTDLPVGAFVSKAQAVRELRGRGRSGFAPLCQLDTGQHATQQAPGPAHRGQPTDRISGSTSRTGQRIATA